MPAPRRLLTTLVAACVLPLGAGCSTTGEPTSAAGGVRAAAPGDRARIAPTPLPGLAVAAADQVPAEPGSSAPPPVTRGTTASPAAAAAGRAAPPVTPLPELVLTRTDLGDDWLMQQPDDAAADEAAHEFCDGPFESDAERSGRIERNFAREDGTRVQQEVNRYSSPAAAERAFAEFVAAFESCADYEPSPGLRMTMTPWTAPREATRRTGVEMTLSPAAGPAVHAALAVYQSEDVLMVLSVVAEQRQAAAPFHVRLAPVAARRAHL